MGLISSADCPSTIPKIVRYEIEWPASPGIWVGLPLSRYPIAFVALACSTPHLINSAILSGIYTYDKKLRHPGYLYTSTNQQILMPIKNTTVTRKKVGSMYRIVFIEYI